MPPRGGTAYLMGSNIEVKAKVRQIDRLGKLAESLADAPPRTILQVDTFFHVPKGRLKLRVFSQERGELIYYERPDKSGPKQCRYSITETKNPESLKTTLSMALGELGTVRKTRTLFMAGQTRIHLDAVEGLGDFMEIEVVMRPGQGVDEAMAIARELMGKLEIAEEDLIDRAYVDLLLDTH